MSNIQKSNSEITRLSLQQKLLKIKQIEETKQEIIKDSEISRMFYQYIIFVLDASRSMRQKSNNNNSKADEVHKAVESVINRLGKSKNVNSFDIGLWCFSDESFPIFKLKSVKELIGGDFNPHKLVNKTGGTNLNQTLIEVEQEIKSYCKTNFTKNHQVLVLLLTDGALDDRYQSLESIKRIKENSKVTVSAMHLRHKIEENEEYYSWNEETDEIDYNKKWTTEEVKKHHESVGERFREFATDDTFFINTIDPDEIRKHMIKSISATSSINP